MKILAAVLLFGAALTAAFPVAADGISHPGVGKEFPGILVSDGFFGNKNAGDWDSRSFLVANAFLSELQNETFRRDGVIDWNLFGRGFFVGPVSKDWPVENEGRGWDKRGEKEDLGAMAVPEPGSLWLILLGLAAVGFVRPRRMAGVRTI